MAAQYEAGIVGVLWHSLPRPQQFWQVGCFTTALVLNNTQILRNADLMQHGPPTLLHGTRSCLTIDSAMAESTYQMEIAVEGSVQVGCMLDVFTQFFNMPNS